MRKRSVCGGGGPVQNQYDPQIGAAAQANSDVAQRAQQFSEDYYNNTIAPLLKQTVDASTAAQGKLGDLYDINIAQAKQAQDQYNQYGIPAQQKYYDMVNQYSAPEEQERQAEAAKGDQSQAEANQNQTMSRQFSAMGIDPTSPAAIAARTNASVMNASAEAGAMNRARNAARSLGMQLTGDAANFGRGGASTIAGFTQGAQSAATGGLGAAQTTLSGANSSAAVPMAGYNTAMTGYGNNLNAYTSAGNTAMNANAESQAAMWNGLGSMAGALGGAAMMKWS